MKRLLSLIVLAALAGCGSSKEPDKTTETTTSTTTTTSSASSSAAPAEAAGGTMHVEVTGPNAVTADLPVKLCMQRPPGKALTLGLAVVSEKQTSGALRAAQIDISTYDHDGTYTIPGENSLIGPMTLTFAKNVQVSQGSASHTTAIVKDNGKSGTFTFSNWHDEDTKAPVSGSITWSCAAVHRYSI